MQSRDTIFALSSGSLPSGVAIVRVSGPETRSTVEDMAGNLPPPRYAQMAEFRDENGNLLDKGLCLFFLGPASFTGEDCAEFHLHGGRAVVESVLTALSARSGVRAAEAGEFTKRAFLNGKVDLAGAEALSDLITAETRSQQRFALTNSEGHHKQLYEDWRRTLINARAQIEAELDFADESDVPGSISGTVWQDVEALRAAIATHLESYNSAEIVREGLKVVILGAPNAGKSSLLNALAHRDVAIVTEEPGTTRDFVEVSLDLDGMKVVLTDTAGIRTAEGRIEAIGIERSLQKAQEADFIIILEDVCEPIQFDQEVGQVPSIRVGNKADVANGVQADAYDCIISAKTGKGLDKLLAHVKEECSRHEAQIHDTIPFRVRHTELLQETMTLLDTALTSQGSDLEIRAEELRLASNSLGRICGQIDVEDLLDTIFSTFCIGK